MTGVGLGMISEGDFGFHVRLLRTNLTPKVPLHPTSPLCQECIVNFFVQLTWQALELFGNVLALLPSGKGGNSNTPGRIGTDPEHGIRMRWIICFYCRSLWWKCYQLAVFCFFYFWRLLSVSLRAKFTAEPWGLMVKYTYRRLHRMTSPNDLLPIRCIIMLLVHGADSRMYRYIILSWSLLPIKH